MVPGFPLLFGRDLHFGEYAGDSIVRQPLPMHFQNAPDNLLLSLVLHDGAIHASFSERQSMHSVYRAACLIKGNSKADESLSDGGFGGREFAGNLP